jgi:hypothetical protein
MSEAENDILRLFRRYQVGEAEMLFFTGGLANPSRKFKTAMQSLIERGMVIKERRQDAYSLTTTGFRASLKV